MSLGRSSSTDRHRLAVLLLVTGLVAAPVVGALPTAVGHSEGAVEPAAFGADGVAPADPGAVETDPGAIVADPVPIRADLDPVTAGVPLADVGGVLDVALPPDGEVLQHVEIVLEDDPSWSAAEPVFRSAFLVGVMVLLGAPLTLLFVVHPLTRRLELEPVAAERATRRLFGGALLAVLVGAVGLALGQEPTIPGTLAAEPVASYLGTAPGSSLLLRAGVVLVLGIVTLAHVVRTTRRSRRLWLGTLVAGGLVLAVSISRTNHSTSAVSSTVGVLVGFGHQVGAGLWVGGVAALALVVPVYLRRTDAPRPVSAVLIRRFSVVAMAGVTLAVATGLAIASFHVPTAGSLGETLYGEVLVLKLLLVGVGLAMGGLNRLVLGRQLQSSPDRDGGRSAVWAGPAAFLALLPTHGTSGRGAVRSFVRSVRLELVVLVLVVVLSGLLTSIPTAADVAEADATERTFDSRVEGEALAVDVVPGHVGENAFVARVTVNGSAVEAEGPPTLTVRRPDGSVTLPGVDLERVEPGTYSAVEPIPSDGRWEVVATARVDGTTVTERVTVDATESGGPADASTSVTEASVADSGFGPTLQYGAVAVAVLGALAVAFELGQLRGRRGAG